MARFKNHKEKKINGQAASVKIKLLPTSCKISLNPQITYKKTLIYHHRHRFTTKKSNLVSILVDKLKFMYS